MLRHECRVGTLIIFGHPNGEKTVGEVTKCNPRKAKVQPIQSRGGGFNVWTVPYEAMQEATEQQIERARAIAATEINDQLAQDLAAFMKRVMKKDGTSPQSALRDILTDLRHVAKKEGLDFDFAVEGSAEVFFEEATS